MKLKHLLSVIITLCALSVCVSPVFSQASRFDSILLSGVPRPIAGANVSVCQAIATTAASVTNNLATYTMASNPITAGYAAGGQLLVAGFTGGDTFFNVGAYNSTSNSITSGAVVLSVSTTGITVALSHANASAGSNGTIIQMGNSTISCAGRSTLYTDQTAGTPSSNPVVTDGRGNFGWWATTGNYYYQVYGPGITTYLHPVTVSGAGAVSSVTGSGAVVVTPTTGATVVSCPTCVLNSSFTDTQIPYSVAGTLTGSNFLTFNYITGSIQIGGGTVPTLYFGNNTATAVLIGPRSGLTLNDVASGVVFIGSRNDANAFTFWDGSSASGNFPAGTETAGKGGSFGQYCLNDATSASGLFQGHCISVGTGNPNSVVSARIGSLYLNLSGGSGTSLYVKESGAGTNTGWVGK